MQQHAIRDTVAVCVQVLTSPPAEPPLESEVRTAFRYVRNCPSLKRMSQRYTATI